MSFEPGTTICVNCRESEEEHCPTCESCPGEITKECCMEGWPEKLKESERRRWATQAAPAQPVERAHADDEGEQNR
jgi:hypothetical protein